MNGDDQLSHWRQKIDEIDQAIHHLISERGEIVAHIGALKRQASQDDRALPTLPIRAGREAQMLRNLLKQHRGSFPEASLIAIWHELIAGYTQVQSGFKVVVTSPSDSHNSYDLARDRFGSITPLHLVPTPQAALLSLSQAEADLAVIPLHHRSYQAESAEWWQSLIENPEAKIIMALPFLARPMPLSEAHALTQAPLTFVVANAKPEPSGDDHTLVAWRNHSSSYQLPPSLAKLQAEILNKGKGWNLYRMPHQFCSHHEELQALLSAHSDGVPLAQQGEFALLGAYAQNWQNN